jgi:hypothetical protein
MTQTTKQEKMVYLPTEGVLYVMGEMSIEYDINSDKVFPRVSDGNNKKNLINNQGNQDGARR